MSRKTPIVAIVGRTNVGKSTLFNAIAGKRLAIVEDVPGVTRDRAYARVDRHGFAFSLVDTGGLVGEEDNVFQTSVQEQAKLAISEAALVIVVFDGLAGVHAQDYEVVNLLRRSEKPILWVINKCEKPSVAEEAIEFYSLGLDAYHCVSAAHQVGIREVIAAIAEHLGAEPSIIEADAEDDAIRVGIIGKPNVGKSTFVNRILGEDRMITSPEAGTTRDSIDVRIKREGQEFIIVDTAGLRKKARVPKDSVERYSGLRTLRALAESDVAVLLLDATDEAPTEQDAKIAGLVHDRGIPLLLVVNKWDAIEKDHRTVREYTRRIYDVFKFARYAPVIFVSSLTGKRCPSVLEKAKEVYEAARVRISTGELNRLMNDAFEHRPPPVYRGEPIKLYFATQIAVAPPTIVLFVNHPKRLPFSYLRYLKNIIRKHYPYEGSNIKLLMRKRSSKEERLAEVAND